MKRSIIVNTANDVESYRVTLPKKEILNLGWNKDTKLDIQRIGKKIVIKQVDSK